ncbi:MAG: hypothetical protein ACREDR_23550 [Blastocatellia bacterium]
MPDKSTALIRVPRITGKYKEVRVTFLGAWFFKPDGSSKPTYADDMFGPFILDEIFRNQSILSKRKGLLKKTHHCRRCDVDLMGLKARKRRFTLNISYKRMPPFKLEIDMPAIPCGSCGASNAINEENTESIIAGAIALAFESLAAAVRKQAAK